MKTIDCFNGDADGICALTQLRLHQPCKSILISGVKRDIKLLARVEAEKGDQVNALDISMDKNKAALSSLLKKGVMVFYCDHHYAGEIPKHPRLTSLINTTADVCTSLLINRHLNGAYQAWAVVGSFGDNLNKSATGLAKSLALSDAQLHALQKLGIYLNYNSYGASLNDLFFDPVELYQKVSQFSSPFTFMNEDASTFGTLQQGYQQDMQNAQAIQPEQLHKKAVIYFLPNNKWARRVSGVFGNELANQFPHRAHAILTERADGDYLVSVRAPIANKQGADQICRQFDGGGGRAAAAGINQLQKTDLDQFSRVFGTQYA